MAVRHRRELADPAPTIAVLGSLNMDLIVRSSRLPSAGETLAGTGFSMMPGGKGGNQALAAARAGGLVWMIGAVGSDDFGSTLVDTLVAAGVHTGRVRRVDGPSGLALITVDAAAENTIVVVSGANRSLTSLDGDDAATIAAADMLVLQLEVPLATVTRAARVAAAAGVPVLLNPSPIQPLPAELLAAVSILVVNQTEAAALAADEVPGGGHVVTTLGAAGARYRGPDGSSAQATPPRVEPMDTTGAGDVFAGALAVAWCRGEDPAAALRWACAAGALATTVPGAGGAAPFAADIDRAAGG